MSVKEGRRQEAAAVAPKQRLALHFRRNAAPMLERQEQRYDKHCTLYSDKRLAEGIEAASKRERKRSEGCCLLSFLCWTKIYREKPKLDSLLPAALSLSLSLNSRLNFKLERVQRRAAQGSIASLERHRGLQVHAVSLFWKFLNFTHWQVGRLLSLNERAEAVQRNGKQQIPSSLEHNRHWRPDYLCSVQLCGPIEPPNWELWGPLLELTEPLSKLIKSDLHKPKRRQKSHSMSKVAFYLGGISH